MSTSEAPRVGVEDIVAAYSRMTGLVRNTPVRAVRGLILKLENDQFGGCIEYRGALNWLLARHSRGEPVVTASAGRFGAAIALAADFLTIHATVFVPRWIDAQALESLRVHGATVRTVDGDLDQAVTAAQSFAAAAGAQFAPFDATEVLAGYGMLGVELVYQVPRLDSIIVPAGLGLAAGLTAWFDQRARVITVDAGQAGFYPTLDGDKPMVRVDVPLTEGVLAAGELQDAGIDVDPIAALPYAARVGRHYRAKSWERAVLVLTGRA